MKISNTLLFFEPYPNSETLDLDHKLDRHQHLMVALGPLSGRHFTKIRS